MRLDKAIVLCIGSVFLSGFALRAQEPAAGQGFEAAVSLDHHESRVADDTKPLLATALDDYKPLTGNERWNLYVRRAFWSPGVFFRAAGPALGAHLDNDPPAWGQGAEGYSKRLANRFGRFALQETYEASAAAALGHEVRYIRSKRSGFLPRAGHALAAYFVTYDREGRRTPHVSRVGAVFAAEFTGRLWMPAGYRDVSTSMRGVGLQMGVGSAFNLIREFAPELKRTFTWR